jgi:hypothetical protein
VRGNLAIVAICVVVCVLMWIASRSRVTALERELQAANSESERRQTVLEHELGSLLMHRSHPAANNESLRTSELYQATPTAATPRKKPKTYDPTRTYVFGDSVTPGNEKPPSITDALITLNSPGIFREVVLRSTFPASCTIAVAPGYSLFIDKATVKKSKPDDLPLIVSLPNAEARP